MFINEVPALVKLRAKPRFSLSVTTNLAWEFCSIALILGVGKEGSAEIATLLDFSSPRMADSYAGPLLSSKKIGS